MGRKKIEMELLKNKDARYVAFSKRKHGLFKKASQLSTLCNARVGVFGFTPGGKPFAFGSPTFQAVTDEYLHEIEGQGQSSNQNVEINYDENENLNNLNEQLMDVTKELKEVEISSKEKNAKVPNISYDGLNLEELQKVKAKLKEFHGDIEAASAMLILAKEPR